MSRRATKSSTSSAQAEFSFIEGRERRYFLGWHAPVITLIHNWLWSQIEAHATDYDLRRWLILVPTRESGRRLREQLAVTATERQTVIIPPRVLTPAAWIQQLIDGENIKPASELLTWMAWAQALDQMTVEESHVIFPQGLAAHPLGLERRKIAQLIANLHRQLAEADHDFSSIARFISADHVDHRRWQAFAQWEKHTRTLLQQSGDSEPDQLRQRTLRSAASHPTWAQELDRFIIAALPDLPASLEPLLLAAENAPCRTEILVTAPEEEKAHFDDWGRPRPEPWLRHTLTLPDSQLHVSTHPQEQAQCVFDLITAHDAPSQTLSLGVPDRSLMTPLQSIGQRQPRPVFIHDPQPPRVTQHELWSLLQGWATLWRESSITALKNWLRLPLAAQWCLQTISPELGSRDSSLLSHLDQFHEKHLASSLDQAAPLATDLVHQVIQLILRLRHQWEMAAPLISLRALLLSLYQKKSFHPNRPHDAQRLAAIKAGLSVAEEVTDTLARLGWPLTPSSWLDLVLAELSERTLNDPHYEEEAVPALGWLELAWDQAPHLIITGLNEGIVPETIPPDPFLPESLRRRLGLSTNADREARDAFLLQGMIQSRREHGRLDLILGRESERGDPLKPSRFLFRVSDDELTTRVHHLFHKKNHATKTVSPNIEWRLQVPAPDLSQPLATLSVTAFKDFLRCPLRFYLRRYLQIASVIDSPQEMSAADFGSLLHRVLRRWGSDTNLTRETSPERLSSTLESFLDDELLSLYGPTPPLTVMVQAQSARRRLHAFAPVQTERTRSGWRVEKVETSISTLFPVTGWQRGNTTIKGTIDRIDFHDEHGWCIIDYKTGARRRGVLGHHLGQPTWPVTGNEAPHWQIAEYLNEKQAPQRQRWIDLQLPLYRLAWQEHRQIDHQDTTPITTGHFYLSKKTTEIGYEAFSVLDDSLMTQAENCALAIIERIQQGAFGTVAPCDDYDEFATLFLGDPTASLDLTQLSPVQ